VLFANLNAAPMPDPLWLTAATGLVPRVIWPTKPQSTTASQFSEWASGRRSAGLSPSLPGELLLHFGYAGSLIAMFALGFMWRVIFVRWGPMAEQSNSSPRGFIYLALMQTFLSLDAGFCEPVQRADPISDRGRAYADRLSKARPGRRGWEAQPH